MTKNSILYTVLLSFLFAIAFISLLALQNNDLKIPQKEVTVKIDVRNKFNVNVASSGNNSDNNIHSQNL